MKQTIEISTSTVPADRHLVAIDYDGLYVILHLLPNISVDGETDCRDSLLTNLIQTSWSVDGETDCRDSLLTKLDTNFMVGRRWNWLSWQFTDKLDTNFMVGRR